MKSPVTIKDFSKGEGPLVKIKLEDQIPLPPPFDKLEEEPPMKPLPKDALERYECLDDTIAVSIPKPESREEEERLVNLFL